MKNPATSIDAPAAFAARHIGPHHHADVSAMLEAIGLDSMDALIDTAIPSDIRLKKALDLPAAQSEFELIKSLKKVAEKNKIFTSFIGMGYTGTITPPVIQRNVLENPGWYTQYTPYQAEISQGRLEALINFQTAVTDLCGLEVANASMLDEATAAAEAMTMLKRVNRKSKSNVFLVDAHCHPQTLSVLQTRAEPMGIELRIQEPKDFTFDAKPFGILLQYPNTWGETLDHEALTKEAHDAGALVAVATDLMALCLLTPPGDFGADCAIGSAQRFGVPMGFGGPHAAFFATKKGFERQMPGRIASVSKDKSGRPAFRLALQTREQHIRREKATSNICTAQVLLANMAGMYAVYHGPEGLKAIAARIRLTCSTLKMALERAGFTISTDLFFDTLRVEVEGNERQAVIDACIERELNVRIDDKKAIGLTVDETTTRQSLQLLVDAFASTKKSKVSVDECETRAKTFYDSKLARESSFLTHPVFNIYHSETEMLRYLHRLEAKDLSLNTSMIPLGSCTMKLNATSEMLPLSWPEFAHLHPFCPSDQAKGYEEMLNSLESMLAEITGFHSVSLQPNAGSQGEYSGLLTIRAFQKAKNQNRNVCLIPQSAHGTNPASAVMCGMKVVIVKCDAHGNIDVEDLEAKAKEHTDDLAALMITYPSTHGVFEAEVRRACDIVHEHGGQVYLDGANLNAQVALCRPGDFGADVCHLNLHKTFCIPHGGGGPGMGPIGVAKHLSPYLPRHPLSDDDEVKSAGAVSAAPFGSASILTISWMYISLLGSEGLEQATKAAILNANYMAARLREGFKILYTGEGGLCAHEFILNCNSFKERADVSVEDIAKRLMDYGYHAPTMSWPVAGTLMVEPTESESKAELDRFCEAMLAIKNEIEKVANGEWPKDNNPLKNAPHPAHVLTGDWNHPYSREEAVFPAQWSKAQKFWPSVERVDNAFGDRNLICSCPPLSAYDD